MNIAGIDIGLSGAMAIVGDAGVLLIADMPVHAITAGKKTRIELDLTSLRSILAGHPIDHVVIERVAARPGQGVSSMFRFGYSAGAVAGMVAGLQLSHSFVLPIAWQRSVGCGPSPDAARQRAAQLYPQIAPQLCRKKDAGRADAILIAHAGRKLLNPAQQVAA
jgi:crossover junction endodeoxyribonuclease RuvC